MVCLRDARGRHVTSHDRAAETREALRAAVLALLWRTQLLAH